MVTHGTLGIRIWKLFSTMVYTKYFGITISCVSYFGYFILLVRYLTSVQASFGSSENISWSKNIAFPKSKPLQRKQSQDEEMRMTLLATDISLSESVPSSKYAWELMGAMIAPTWCYLRRQECSFWSPVCVYILITRVCLCIWVCFYADFDSSVCFPVHFTPYV